MIFKVININYFAFFVSNTIINYGYTSIYYSLNGGGCGYAKDIKIYPNFSFNQISDINPY